LSSLWLLPIALLNCFAIGLAFNVLSGSLAFFTVESSGIKNAIGHMSHFLAGGLIPLYLFPDTIEKLLLLSPFPSMLYVPTVLLQNTKTPTELLPAILAGLLWSGVLLAWSLATWRAGLKRYEAVGI